MTLSPTAQEDILFVPVFDYTDIDDKNIMLYKLNLIVSALNNKKSCSFEQTIDDTARNILFIPTQGSFIVIVRGEEDTMPCLISACSKSTQGSVGSVTNLDSQAGTGSWNTNVLSITSTSSNFQIAHDLAATSGTFMITVVGWL